MYFDPKTRGDFEKGKVMSEKEFEDQHSEEEDVEEDEEEESEHEEDSDSEFDDPEGYVDNISDEGRIKSCIIIYTC